MVPPDGTARLILASASPRRLDLLRQIGIEPTEILPADIDETPRKDELPGPHAERLAREKAEAISANNPGWILAADTVVACGRRILPKAEDETTAVACLELLSGRRHRVFGGVAVKPPHGNLRSRLVTTVVGVKRLTPAEIDRYLSTGEWQGKAGGYAIQGHAGVFIPFINGSYFNVVGLPLYETAALLDGLGYPRSRS